MSFQNWMKLFRLTQFLVPAIQFSVQLCVHLIIIKLSLRWGEEYFRFIQNLKMHWNRGNLMIEVNFDFSIWWCLTLDVQVMNVEGWDLDQSWSHTGHQWCVTSESLQSPHAASSLTSNSGLTTLSQCSCPLSLPSPSKLYTPTNSAHQHSPPNR